MQADEINRKNKVSVNFLTQNLSSDHICGQSNLDQKKEEMNFSEVAAETIEMRNVIALASS